MQVNRRTCIVANVIVGIDATHFLALKDVGVPCLTIDWVMQNVIERGNLHVGINASYLCTQQRSRAHRNAVITTSGWTASQKFLHCLVKSCLSSAWVLLNYFLGFDYVLLCFSQEANI